ncbi:MAG: hypothetical protein OZ921_09060, partial [Sorangiineae bacterium]|nr:hypothetical protein [Sorangiineae bacterium]
MASLPPLRASVALAAYAEPLLEGRRAIVFGDASSGLAEQLLERGARLVHVYDADAPRLAEAAARNGSRNVAFAPLAEGGLAVREGAFDVAFIENLSAFEDVSEVLRHAKRALSPRGALLAAAPNPEARLRLLAEPAPASTALDYYALYDAASATFAEVRMLGQAPFVGYAVVDFAPEGEPAPSFDAGFVPGGAEEPEWFIALCSEREVRLDEFALIELPFRATRERERPATREPARELAPMRAELAELRAELERREAWITQVEARAEAADTRADQAQAELEERRAAVDAAVERARGAEASARDAEARGRAAAGLRAELETRRARGQKLVDERVGLGARAR